MNNNSISRRPFLKTAIGAGLAATLVQGRAQQDDDSPDKKKLGWAIVGLGGLSKGRIGPALKKTKHAHMAGVVTGTAEKAKEWQKKYGFKDSGIYNYDNFDEVIKNPDIDVVYLVLPNSMHKEFTLRAAKAGKHVYVEKPMATSPEECREMIDACDKAGVKLGVAYRLQFEPHHKEMIRFAKDKTFGNVRHMDAGFCFRMGGSDGWRLKKAMGGGALFDVGVYAIQGARYVFGEEPVTVSALETKTDPKKFAEVDETVTWTMQFASGKTANLICSFNMGGYNQLTVFADKGRFGMAPCFGTRGQKGWTSDPKTPLDFPQTEHFQVQMDIFSQAIMDGKDSTVSGLEGLKDHLVMEAVFKSIASGKAEAVGKV
ncbi:Gfo/Idh/MocA family oxidoreductase [Verrucomicrobiaceae bacterium R5-34]|nr:Gfo/Idh/MocA family oxidoreductase [Verrucomicrobiaceae bacterium R5-34]